MTTTPFPLKAFVFLGLFSLAACGGGGGGGDTPPPPQNNAPTAEAGPQQTVNELDAVTLDGSASSDPDGDALTFAWSQVAGPDVVLANGTTASPSFDAPLVTATQSPVTLTFRLTVRDTSNASNSDTVDIVVNDAGLGANNPPVASAGPDQSVAELVTVSLDGTASFDVDGDTLTFAWIQTVGAPVSLSNADTATPSFTAPDVQAGVPQTFTFQLTVSDGVASDVDAVSIVVAEPQTSVAISGRILFEKPERNDNFCRGYDLDNPPTAPVRRLPVELRSSSNALLATTMTADDGSYSFSDIALNTDVRIRVRAELVQAGPPGWEVYVRDNTANTAQPLTNRPIYVVQFDTFNTGVIDITNRDFVARTGWSGTGYTGERAAAPLAILDALLEGFLLVGNADPTAVMGRLDAFWSINNSWTGESLYDVGRLPTTFYSSDPDFDSVPNPSLFLLGDAVGLYPETLRVDTDEFDRGVILHEWGHFFEDELSRSDSIGGAHVIPEELEARLAFGEGWGYGIAAIAGGDPLLCDTSEPSSTGSSLNVETWVGYGTHGFFNEMSVATLLYDLYDPANEGTADGGTIGFAPIYDVMTGPQRLTPAFTTIFSFAAELALTLNPADLEFLQRLLTRENVDTSALDIWGDGQTTAPVGWRDVLPVYTDLPTDGSTIQVCVNRDRDADGDGNNLGEWRYLRFTTTSQSRWRVFAQANPLPPAAPNNEAGAIDTSDPDLWLYRTGDWLNICTDPPFCIETGSGISVDANTETMDTALLDAGTYVIAFNEYVYCANVGCRFEEVNIASNYPDQMCFDITANPR